MGEDSSGYDAKYRDSPFGKDESAVVPPPNLEEDKEKPEKGKEAKSIDQIPAESIESTESKTREERMQEAREAFSIGGDQEIPLMRGMEELGGGWKLVNVDDKGTAKFSRVKPGPLVREDEIIELKDYPIKSEPVSSEQKPLAEPISPVKKAHSLLDKDIQEIESPKEPKWSREAYSWLQKNSKLRIATGVITSVLGAYFGGNVGIYAAKGIMGAISGGIGFSGLNSYLKERAATKNFEKMADENGELDLNKIADRLNGRHTIDFNINKQDPENPQVFDDAKTKQELLDLYAEFTEISSVRGQKILEVINDKSERSKNVLQEKFPRLFDNKAVNWYRNKNWYTKALIGLGVGLGAGFLGGAAFGGALTAKVACSGIASLGVTAFQDTDDRSGKTERYSNSDKVIKIKDALEKIGLSEEDMQYIAKHREEIKKRSITVGIAGAAVMSIVLTGLSYNSSHHQGSEHAGGSDPKGANENAYHAGAKPAVTMQEQPHGINKPSVSAAPEQPHSINPLQEHKTEMYIGDKTAGSENLSDELKGVEKIDAGVGASDRYAVKMVEGLEGKGQVHFQSPEDRISMIEGVAHELREKGIFDARDGHLEKIEEFKNINPLELARNASVSVNTGETFADINLDKTGVDQIHNQIEHKAPLETNYASLENNEHATGAMNRVSEQSHENSVNNHGETVPEHHTPQNEAAAKQEIEKATGLRTPDTWRLGGDPTAYTQGKSLVDPGMADQLKSMNFSRDSLNMLNRLVNDGSLKVGDVHVSADGNSLMMPVGGGHVEGGFWTVPMKHNGIFTGWFSNHTAKVDEIFKGVGGQTAVPVAENASSGFDGTQNGKELKVDNPGDALGQNAKPTGPNTGVFAVEPKPAENGYDPTHFIGQDGKASESGFDMYQSKTGAAPGAVEHAVSQPTGNGAEENTILRPHAATQSTQVLEPSANVDTSHMPPMAKDLIDHGGHFEAVKNGVYKIVGGDGKPGYFGPVDSSSQEYKSYIEHGMANYDSYKLTHPDANPLKYRDYLRIIAPLEILKQRFGDK